MNEENELTELEENSSFEATFTLIINPINDPPAVEKIEIEVYEDEIYEMHQMKKHKQDHNQQN